MKRTEVELLVESKTSFHDYNEGLRLFTEQEDIQKMVRAIPSNTLDVSVDDYVAETGVKSNKKVKIQTREYYKQWIGRVIEIEDNESFVAKIEPIQKNDDTEKIVRFNYRRVKMLNVDQFREGSVFYWTVGLFSDSKGTLTKQSEIRFQLLTPPSPQMVAALEDEIGKIYDGITWME